MELKRRLDPRWVFVGLYVVMFAIYIIVGLQPAGAAEYNVSTELSIPAVGLSSEVTELEPDGNTLPTPDTIVGSYSQAENKTLLIGHSTTAFEELSAVQLGDTVDYNGKTYTVKKIETRRKVEIKMNEILKGSDQDTIIMMTCAGQLLDGGDATHRLMVTATR